MEDFIINSMQVTDRPTTQARFLILDSEDATAVEMYEHTLDKLRSGVAVFIIAKKDGSYRKCIGTLNEATIPKERGEEARKYHKPSPLNQSFYDLQLNEFRSFGVDRVVALLDF